MGHLRAPGLGPIVGHTTHESCRLWIRADPVLDSEAGLDSDRRTVGVLGVFEEGGTSVEPDWSYYFRLHREFDRTGAFNLGIDPPPRKGAKRSPSPRKLKPNTLYRIRVGTLTLDDPLDDREEFASSELFTDRLPQPSVWREDLARLPADKSEALFRTFPAPSKSGERVDFLLGSCRYPGLLWKVRHSDRIFEPMARLVAQGQKSGKKSEAPDFVLMVGDQVYADMYNRMVPFGRAETYEEFRERYITAFASPNLRRLMRTLPTYMILDDHEIEDNWTQDRIRRDAKYLLFTISIDAYLSYQWSHGPRSYGKRLYYKFDHGGFPFFVVDTRTQRYLEGPEGVLDDNHMLGRPTLPGAVPGQLQRLLEWLVEQQTARGNVPKFIVTSSVFVPSPMSSREELKSDLQKEKSDSWPGFPRTRQSILECIVKNDIQNVVFLSGDIHCANVAQIFLKGTKNAEKLRAYSVTSSAFYWPFPFADGEPSDFVHDSTKRGQKDTFTWTQGRSKMSMDYKAWNFTQEDNFCRLTADRKSHSLRVRTFDRDGEIVREEVEGGKKLELDEKLDLAPW